MAFGFGDDEHTLEGKKVRVSIVPHFRGGFHVYVEPRNSVPNPIGHIGGIGGNPNRVKVGHHEQFTHARRHALRVLDKFDR